MSVHSLADLLDDLQLKALSDFSALSLFFYVINECFEKGTFKSIHKSHSFSNSQFLHLFIFLWFPDLLNEL